MPLDFNPSQRSSMYLNTLPTDNKPKKSSYSPHSENSTQELLNSWGYDAFKEKGPEGLLNDLIYEAENKFPNQQDKQEALFEEAVDLLIKLNWVIHDDPNAIQVDKDAFREATEIVEAELTKRVHESPLPASSKFVERTTEEKINTFIKTYHEPVDSSSIITDAHGEKYKTVADVVHDGNCGLNACKRTTDKSGVFSSSIERAHLVRVIEENKKLYAYGEELGARTEGKSTNTDPIAINFDLEMIFGSLPNCKLFLENKITYELSKSDLSVGTKENLVEIQKKINRTSNLNELFKDPLILHAIYKSNSSFEFSPTADQSNDWLTNGDVKAFMLSKGYDSVHDGIRDDDKEADIDAKTVMKFKHLLTDNEAYIANSSRPLPKTQSLSQKEGTHWVCVEKMTVR